MICLDYTPIIALSPAQRVQAAGQLTRMPRKLSLAGQRRNRHLLFGDTASSIWGATHDLDIVIQVSNASELDGSECLSIQTLLTELIQRQTRD